jgi:hypothetical protein
MLLFVLVEKSILLYEVQLVLFLTVLKSLHRCVVCLVQNVNHTMIKPSILVRITIVSVTVLTTPVHLVTITEHGLVWITLKSDNKQVNGRVFLFCQYPEYKLSMQIRQRSVNKEITNIFKFTVEY